MASTSSRPNPNTASEKTAMAFVEELSRGEYSHPKTTFDATMSSVMNADKVRDMWQSIESSAGHFVGVEGTKLSNRDGFDVVMVTTRFEHFRKNIKVVLDQKSQVAGLFYGPVSEDLEALARKLIEASSKGDFSAATADFGPEMKAAMPSTKMAETWAALESKSGKVVRVERVEVKPEAGYFSALALTKLDKDLLTVKVVFDAKNQVAGLFFQPAEQGVWAPASYVKSASFDEEAVTVGSSPALPGTLSIPKGSGPFPAVVLVHGSGPSDRDESVGGVKVFKDIAGALASQGIVVLRYDKRSRVSPTGIVTQKEEVLDAAHEALSLLKKTAKVDPNRVVVLGHSQGGNLAPRIAKENPGLAGIVSLAGNTRSLQELIVDQLSYFAALSPGISMEQKVIDAQKFKARVESADLKPTDDVLMPVGQGVMVKGAYFLEMRGYDPAATAKGLSCKVLVMQGDRDYQVTTKDLQGWRTQLESSPNATIKEYPKLNHLLVSGEGRSTPAEYEAIAHVDEALLNDLIAWVKTLPAAKP